MFKLYHQKKEKFDFLFIIPLSEEFEIFTELIEIKSQITYGAETFYIVNIPNSDYTGIVAVCFEAGISRAVNITKTSLNLFDVKMVINIGIAGGINDDLKLGDVVIAKSVIEYQADSKAKPNNGNKSSYKTLRSPNVIPVRHILIQNINHFRFQEKTVFNKFQETLKNYFIHLKLRTKAINIVNDKPNYFVGKIASGNTVIATELLIKEIQEIERKIAIVEMEAAGISRVTWEMINPIPTLIIRGVSDLADKRKSTLDNALGGVYRKYAMHNAIQFFLFLVQTKSFQKVFTDITFFGIPEELKLNDIQKKLRDIFSQNPYKIKKLNLIYIGAKKVILEESNPERYYQCAYSLKDLIQILLEEIEITDKNPILKKMESFIMKVDEIHGSPIDKFVNQWYDLYVYFNKITSRSIEPIPEIFNENFSKLELVISSLIVPIYDVITELEKLMDIENPTDEDMEKVKSSIGTHALYRHFFRSLKNPNWLLLLEKNGYYNDPPEEGKYSVEPLYLLNISDQIPSDVVRIIKKLSNTQNKYVQVIFLEIILKLPIKNVGNLKEEIKSWINIPFSENFALFARLQELINKLYEENEKDLATELSESILDLERYFSIKNNSGAGLYD